MMTVMVHDEFARLVVQLSFGLHPLTVQYHCACRVSILQSEDSLELGSL